MSDDSAKIVRFPDREPPPEPAPEPLPAKIAPTAGEDWRRTDISLEDRLALFFAERYAGQLLHVAAWGTWLRWTGAVWLRVERGYVLDLLRDCCRDAKEITAEAERTRKVVVWNALDFASRYKTLTATPGEFDGDPMLLNTPGGVVNLEDGTLRAHRAGDLFAKITSVGPGGDCPRFKQFLAEITGGDADFARYLQSVAGYALTGRTDQQEFWVAHGPGGNGKTILAQILSIVLGSYAATAPIETFLQTKGERHPTDLAALAGARFVVTSEADRSARWAEAKLKLLTGTDKVRARFMFKDGFEFVPTFKLFVVVNHLPALENVDDAMKRRLRVLPFGVTISPEKRDLRLLEKLEAEAGGILAWALAGASKWAAYGLKPPPAVTAASQAYFEAQDPIARWTREALVRDRSAWASTADLLASYAAWAEESDAPAFTRKVFSAALKRRSTFTERNLEAARGFSGYRIVIAEESVEK